MKIILFTCSLFILTCTNNNQRSFQFTYEVKLDSTNGKKFEMWLPLPQSNAVQTISNFNMNAGGLSFAIKDEENHGNKYLYFYNKKNGITEPTTVKMTFDVLRKEHQNVHYKNVDPAKYLRSNSTVPTGELFSPIINENNLSSNNIRGIYDFVLSGMHYGKPKSIDDIYYADPWLSEDSVYGRKKVTRDEVVSIFQKAKKDITDYTFGNGNSIYACEIGVGNCTDYHSYFMSLGRSLGIPVRFHMGFPVPEDESGTIDGYHCWADFYEDGKGWTPVDISEADKNPVKADYFFGTLDDNRIEFMVGRDFELVNYNGGAVNIFIYPIVEVDDKQVNTFSKKFSYKNI